MTDFLPVTDWLAVKMLADWTLDGVLISTDDDVELDDTNQPQLSRDDGVLMNVCIQGPTAMRNTAPQISSSVESHMWNPQYIDQGIHVMDKVFVGLFSNENDDGSRYSFYYKLFSGRQALAMRTGGAVRGVDSYGDGPTADEFRNCVGAHRVGSVMDNKLTTTVDRHIQLNVVVEWWTVRQLRQTYDDRIGVDGQDELEEDSGAAAIVVAEEAVEAVEDEGEEAMEDLIELTRRRSAAQKAGRRADPLRSTFTKQLAALAREL